jgi:uncharacterized protein with von Willebrand factor type A (vWA) domain
MGDNLAHVYDAVKRREYYLKTRQLKGRRHAIAKIDPPKLSRAQRQALRNQQLEAKITKLKGRLERLQKVLAADVKEAQARSGVKPTKSSDAPTSPQGSRKNSPDQKLTASQKAKKAEQEKKYREKNKPQTLDEQVQSLTKRIKIIQERIAKMRKNGSVGARSTTAK